MAKRDRDRRPARRFPFKDSRPVLLIVCEGEITEPQYFESLATSCRNSRVRVKCVPGVGVPQTIVDAAKELKRAAKRRANRKTTRTSTTIKCGVFSMLMTIRTWRMPNRRPLITELNWPSQIHALIVALAPSFWLSRHIQHRHDLQRMLQTRVPDYDKHVDFESFAHGIDDAILRARKMDSEAVLDAEPGETRQRVYGDLRTIREVE